MKFFYLFGVLLLAAVWVQAEEESTGLQDITKDKDDDVDLKEAVKELFEKKCTAAGGKELLQKVEAALDTAKVCLEQHVPKTQEELKDAIRDEDSSSEEICQDRHKIHKCFKEFIDAITECAHAEEKYLPEFVFDALDGVFDYVCADDGAAVFKLFDDTTLECIFTLAEHENITEICDEKFKFLDSETPEDIVITKSELCSDLTIAKACYAEFIQEQCPEDKNLKELITGLYDAVSAPCNKNVHDLKVRRRK